LTSSPPGLNPSAFLPTADLRLKLSRFPDNPDTCRYVTALIARVPRWEVFDGLPRHFQPANSFEATLLSSHLVDRQRNIPLSQGMGRETPRFGGTPRIGEQLLTMVAFSILGISESPRGWRRILDAKRSCSSVVN
jgi:hypothetical protein